MPRSVEAKLREELRVANEKLRGSEQDQWPFFSWEAAKGTHPPQEGDLRESNGI